MGSTVIAHTLGLLRDEINYMRGQVGRHRREILRLERAGMDVAAAVILMERMQAKIEDLCIQRNELAKAVPNPTKGKVGRRKWGL